jgi:2-C-methyl-D-erythritol 4-phosphate cytidylyltransferase
MGPSAAIVVAAGGGTRFGAAKQFSTLAGIRLVDRAVAAATASCDTVVLVLPAATSWDGAAVDAVVAGGATRADSVRGGLAAVPAPTEVVVVHDAARPLATPELFAAVIAAVRGGADAAVPAVALVDTIKRVDAAGRVHETVPREALVAVQTPQAFRVDALRAAHAAGGDATDDAALVEAAGGTVVVVPGDDRNLKVTTALDLIVVAALLGAES